jgi:hypothetical protein
MADRSRLQPGLALLLLLLLLLVSSVAEAKDLYKAITFFYINRLFFSPLPALFLQLLCCFRNARIPVAFFFFCLGLEYITSTRIGRLAHLQIDLHLIF